MNKHFRYSVPCWRTSFLLLVFLVVCACAAFDTKQNAVNAGQRSSMDTASIGEQFQELRARYHALRSSGHDVKEVEPLILDLREAFEAKQWPRVSRLLDQLDTELAQIERTANHELDPVQIQKRFGVLQKRYRELVAAGHDLGAAEALIQQLRSAAAEKNWLEVSDLLGRLELEFSRVDAEKAKASAPRDANELVGKSAFGVFGDYVREGGHYNLDLAKELGNQVARIQFPWWAIEPKAGQFDFKLADELIDTHRKAGISPLVTILSNSTWATLSKGGFGTIASSPADDPELFKRFLTRVVRRYKDDVNYWQIENEIYYAGGGVNGFWDGSAEDYVRHLKLAYEVISREDPEGKVVLNGVPDEVFVGIAGGEEKAVKHLEYLLKEGGRYFDVIDFHQYLRPGIVRLQVKQLKEMMQRFDLRKELISTEAGGFDVRLLGLHLKDKRNALDVVKKLHAMPEVRNRFSQLAKSRANRRTEMKSFNAFLKRNAQSRALVERYQSEDLVKRVSLTLGLGATQFYWVCMRDFDEKQAPTWFNVAMCLVDRDGRRKPSFYTYRLLIDKLRDFSNAQIVRIDPTVAKFTFPNRPPVLVAWADDSTRIDTSKELDAERVRITHIITAPGLTDRDAHTEEVDADAVLVGKIPILVEPSG